MNGIKLRTFKLKLYLQPEYPNKHVSNHTSKNIISITKVQEYSGKKHATENFICIDGEVSYTPSQSTLD